MNLDRLSRVWVLVVAIYITALCFIAMGALVNMYATANMLAVCVGKVHP